MTRALVLSEHDFADWGARFRTGRAPAPLPYEVNALEASGFRLRGVDRRARPRWGKARDLVEHRAGFPVERAVRGALSGAPDADLVLALLEREGFAAGVAKRLRVPPYATTPLAIWSCWLADDLRRADPATRRALVRRVEAADLITHLSRHETEIFVDAGVPEERLFPVTYGVSHDYYRPGPDADRDIPLLAVGQDRGRDYATLMDAVRDTDLTLDLVCKPENLAGLDIPGNVRMHGTVPLPVYRQLLRRAQVVVVPTRELAYPTGSSVALESASSGCCVAVTGTRSMRDYVADGRTGRLVDEGDVAGWRSLLLELRDDPGQRVRLGTAARRQVEERFNARFMWTELAGVLRERGIISPT